MKKTFTLEEVREIIAHLQSFNNDYLLDQGTAFSIFDCEKWKEGAKCLKNIGGTLDSTEKRMIPSLYGQLMASLEMALGDNPEKLKGAKSVIGNIFTNTIDRYYVKSHNMIQELINGERGWFIGNLYNIADIMGMVDKPTDLDSV